MGASFGMVEKAQVPMADGPIRSAMATQKDIGKLKVERDQAGLQTFYQFPSEPII